MNRLRKALLDGSFLLDLEALDIGSVLRAGLDFVEARGLLDKVDRDEIEDTLVEREHSSPTAIGNSVAIPHAYSEKLTTPLILFIRLRHPLNLDAPDGVAVRYVFLLLGPPGAAEQHLDALAGIARLMSDDQFRYEAGIARTQLDLLAALERFQDRNQPVEKSPRKKVEDGLVYTGKFCGGLSADLKRRLPHYVSDFTDGLNGKSIASVLFLFFACLAPAVTFGGIMAQLTENQIGVVEMLVATAGCGALYALFAGQPLILLGGTGPLLVFTWVLYVLCQQMGLSEYFLETYAWVGIWTAVLLLLMSATDASCLMRYVTRFTDETFGALMSIIFIYTAIKAVATVVTDVYAETQTGHDEALVP
ncbi:MAG: PTS sugar transporter subunit IIA, partial [Planctomycetaceae bacterium]|nr:PTS sugar transporter subunit IIA [Planctomycetaceae bacterium]